MVCDGQELRSGTNYELKFLNPLMKYRYKPISSVSDLMFQYVFINGNNCMQTGCNVGQYYDID